MMRSIVCFAAGCLLAYAPLTLAQDDKAEISKLTREAINKILADLGNKELGGDEKRTKVRATIDAISDMDLLAKLVLGRTNWGKASAEQRTEFSKIFGDTIHLSMFEKLELFTDERVDIGEVSKLDLRGSPKYRVATWIVSKGTRTELGLLFAKRDAGWRVFDVEIKGVSVRKSYGNQYNDYLRSKSMAQLLETMRGKVAELLAKAKASESK